MEEGTTGVERKVFITRSVLALGNGDGEGVVRRVQVGGQGSGERIGTGIGREDGVLWGFHGWCSREFAYRASVTSPLAGSGHSRLGISPGADLRDNGDHSYGKSDEEVGCL